MKETLVHKWLKYTENQESPSHYHLWCALFTIAAILERRVYIDRAFYTLYPNLYIVLVGPSAKTRKSTAIGIVEKFIRASLEEPAVISQKITTQALILALKERGKVADCAAGIVLASELDVFLRGDDELIRDLTQLYDCPDPFEARTIGRGKDTCPKACLNILGGTTPDWMSVPISALGGGLFGRIIFVYQDSVERRIAFPFISKEAKVLKEEIIERLKKISVLEGEFTFSSEGRTWFTDWYEEVLVLEGDGEITGYLGRKHDSLLKVSMGLSVAESDSLVLDTHHLETSLNLLNENEKKMGEVLQLAQTTISGRNISKVQRAISKETEITHSTLLTRLSYCMNSEEIKGLIEHLKESNEIEESVVEGKKVYRKKD